MQQFSKSDIDLLVEIRQRLKAELGEVVKMSDPNLLNQLVDYWYKTSDAITRSRIRSVMERMGEDWKRKIAIESGPHQNLQSQTHQRRSFLSFR